MRREPAVKMCSGKRREERMSDDDLQHRWHRALCQELEQRVKGRKFLVWVNAQPGQGEGGPATTPEEVDPQAWEALGQSTEEWLEGLHQATTDPNDPPKHELRVADVRFELSAAPKKTKRQGTGSLIANPFPGIATFTESYSAGPADPFDAED
jgi:hypothetical protein